MIKNKSLIMFCYLLQSLGNHEFDNGVAGLTPFIENIVCPVLAANLVLNKEPELSKVSNLMKSKVFHLNNISIGIIGYLTPETKFLAVGNNVEYEDEIEAIRQEVDKLQIQGIKILIALGHSGFTKDKEIAKEVEGLDLVIGGHTNTFLWNGSVIETERSEDSYPTFIKQSSGRIVPVVQAYAYTKYLGQLKINFDSSGEAISMNGSPILLDNHIPQDEDVLKIIHQYQDGVTRITEEVIGNTSILLDGTTCQRHECNLGNMIADAMVLCYAYDYKGDYWTDTAIGIIQGGGIRSSIESKDITMGDLLTVMPFESNLAIVEVSGSILLEMLEHAVFDYDSQDPPGEFLQLSGIRVVYDLSRPPSHRVVKAIARCWMCDFPSYNSIDVGTQYKIILPSFLADGGDGYSMLKAMPKTILSYNELKCAVNYVHQHSPVLPETDGRIQFLQSSRGSDSIFKTASRTIVLCGLLLNVIPR